VGNPKKGVERGVGAKIDPLFWATFGSINRGWGYGVGEVRPNENGTLARPSSAAVLGLPPLPLLSQPSYTLLYPDGHTWINHSLSLPNFYISSVIAGSDGVFSRSFLANFLATDAFRRRESVPECARTVHLRAAEPRWHLLVFVL